MTTRFVLGQNADEVDYGLSTSGVMVFSAGGDDLIIGSAFADSMNGGSGFDRLRGGGGDDFIRGGADHDRVQGGSGNDTFIFHKGDLVIGEQTGGQIDHIVDFHGSGGYKAWTGVEDDFISFFGFTDGRLEFSHFMGGDTRFQIYNVYDGCELEGNILVQMADCHGLLDTGDYKFF